MSEEVQTMESPISDTRVLATRFFGEALGKLANDQHSGLDIFTPQNNQGTNPTVFLIDLGKETLGANVVSLHAMSLKTLDTSKKDANGKFIGWRKDCKTFQIVPNIGTSWWSVLAIEYSGVEERQYAMNEFNDRVGFKNPELESPLLALDELKTWIGQLQKPVKIKVGMQEFDTKDPRLALKTLQALEDAKVDQDRMSPSMISYAPNRFNLATTLLVYHTSSQQSEPNKGGIRIWTNVRAVMRRGAQGQGSGQNNQTPSSAIDTTVIE